MNGQMKVDKHIIERNQSTNKTVEFTIPKKLNLASTEM